MAECVHVWTYVRPYHTYPPIGIDWARTCNPPIHTHDEFRCQRCLTVTRAPTPEWESLFPVGAVTQKAARAWPPPR